MNIAFIIPIHPKHYHYIYDLINIIEKTKLNIPIYLVFSSYEDYQLLKKKDNLIFPIILPIIDTKNIVTYKKYFALEKLKNNTKYDYFIVCDAEITIIPTNFTEKNILNKIKQIYDNKIIYAGEVSDNLAINITKNSCEIIDKNNKLKQLTNDYTLYYWWSDLPVYKREHLNDFFSKFIYKDITFFHFDHLIYLNYLLLYHDFTILNITPLINHKWSLEMYLTTDNTNLELLKKNNYGFSYLTNKFYYQHRFFLENEGSFLIYHLDRI